MITETRICLPSPNFDYRKKCTEFTTNFHFILYVFFPQGISIFPAEEKPFKLLRRQDTTDGTLKSRTGRVTAKEGSRRWVCPYPRLSQHESALQVPIGQEVSYFPRRVP